MDKIAYPLIRLSLRLNCVVRVQVAPPVFSAVDITVPNGFPPGANGRVGFPLSGGDMLPIPEALKSDFPGARCISGQLASSSPHSLAVGSYGCYGSTSSWLLTCSLM